GGQFFSLTFHLSQKSKIVDQIRSLLSILTIIVVAKAYMTIIIVGMDNFWVGLLLKLFLSKAISGFTG
ncbi:MAG TPA: hypothetical protein DDX01_01195, partial [Holosporales bacterium]|nr:hypothetical protein [Holosporales bacterium]